LFTAPSQDVVVGTGEAVLELISREDEALLVRGDALLVLDLVPKIPADDIPDTAAKMTHLKKRCML
jgi:hypothetical protein